MRYLDLFRDPGTARSLVHAIHACSSRPWRVMEICGGQTHTLVRSGIDQLLEGAVELIHGPGCPVCVTPLEKIDRALAIAARDEVIFTSYGDMLRVPGSDGDLLAAKAAGADVRIVYSPLDAVELAERNPDREVVFFAVGFETTAPPNAMAAAEARRRGIGNFSVLISHVRVPPAISMILGDPACRLDGFIAPGHVCSIMGTGEYEELARAHGLPFVIAGFEPLDLLGALHRLVTLLEEGRVEVDNHYARSVRASGNPAAQALLDEMFTVGDMGWRGIGIVPRGGLHLADAWADLDAERRFAVEGLTATESAECIAGEILQGRRKPHECPAFATTCTPENPRGAPMVSNEGACSAYYAYRRGEEAGHAS